MLKRLILALAMLAGLLSPAWSAGTVPGFSLTPQFDLTGALARGCKLYIIQAGTTSTPQTAYQDSGLTIPAVGGSTLTCDAAGRLPQWFVADGNIKLRLTTSGGTQIFVGDGILVVGASSGGGGGSPVDATTILATGDVKSRYGTGVLTGFVRLNGRTIGSATSGATERANSDCQALFEYLWAADTNLAVSTGRGVSANADWVANKQLTLPDGRGRVLAAMDDMGNTSAGRLTTAAAGVDGLTLGTGGGAPTVSATIAQANLPNVNLSAAGLNVFVSSRQNGAGNFSPSGGSTLYLDLLQTAGGGGTSSINITPSGSVPLGGSGTALSINKIPPLLVVTNYVKL